ncbi:type I-E CRISPR-associated protein Cse2/CasB [Kitasatospora sp. NPDC058478]|uniref:type I-E CRISPR-associated protein Cse2/CasB n=1 Tax=unclassified Kitasatospora TaxID=2633591 RepID=UPI00364AF3B3
MAQTRRDPAALEAWKAANELVHWLQHATRNDPLFLLGLRRGKHPLVYSDILLRAYQEGREEVYLGVSRLFAHYHRAPREQVRQQLGFGSGSMGTALARLSWTEHNPAHSRGWLYLDAFVRARARLPWRELTKVCNTLRDREVVAPDWRELVVDLSDWSHPRGRSGARERWFEDFHATCKNRADL